MLPSPRFSVRPWDSYVTALGLINTFALRIAKEMTARQADVALRQCTEVYGQELEELRQMSAILSSLSKLDVGCAELFGISITKRMLNVMWGEMAVTILIAVQAFMAYSWIFTPYFLSCPAHVDSSAWVKVGNSTA